MIKIKIFYIAQKRKTKIVIIESPPGPCSLGADDITLIPLDESERGE